MERTKLSIWNWAKSMHVCGAMITLFGNNVKFEAMRKELCGVVQAARNPFLATTTDIFTFNSRSKIKCSPVNGWFQ